VAEGDHLDYLNLNGRVISQWILCTMRTCTLHSSGLGYGQTASAVNTAMNLRVP